MLNRHFKLMGEGRSIAPPRRSQAKMRSSRRGKISGAVELTILNVEWKRLAVKTRFRTDKAHTSNFMTLRRLKSEQLVLV